MKKQLLKIIDQALREDVYRDDITTNSLIPARSKSRANVIVKQNAVICGVDIMKQVFQRVDSTIIFRRIIRDGTLVRKGTLLAAVRGSSRSLLKAERVALNFISHLSGIATETNRYVKAVRPLKTQILDTRKTTPGLRLLEKYAVKCGGGVNHRFDLSEMVMIKDNHREVCRPQISIAESIRLIRRRTKKKIEVEVDTLKQFDEALAAKPDIILLDNMSTAQMKTAVARVKKQKSKVLLEASGGITLRNIRKTAQTGVHRISIGALTHTHQNIDVSLEFVK
ncbi:MAG: carboxylating nicotinate-nucleotide diphosphorylase [Candidatus Omnitrophica bacterium]|nr:carboxylating nicotinate-nucleotide diphosphorylase [Candidatus Omnitrophota bacterium]